MTSSIFRQTRRYRVLSHYSGGVPKCSCCGEDKLEFLAIDHQEGSGNEHRRQMGRSTRLFDWLHANGLPGGFRVLCHNCNCAIGFYGYCPHQVGSILQKRVREHLDRPPGQGSRHHAARLSEDDVRVIRRRIADGDRYIDIAADFKICKATVSHIANGRLWKNVA